MRIKIFLMLAILLPKVSSSQEMIREVYEEPSSFSMARLENLEKNWVVYNENADYSSFGLIDTSGIYAQFVRTQQHIHVKDMLVLGDTLYFCGSIYDCSSKTDIGVMGRFTISEIKYSPSTMTVKYMPFEEFKVLKKMDRYDMNGCKHVVMVGTGQDGKDYIVDAYTQNNPLAPNPNAWYRAWAYMPNIDAVFDDIAVAYSKVVVSARIENQMEVQLCFIAPNPLITGPFFNTSVIDMVKVPGEPTDRVLLQHVDKDTVFAIYRRGPYLDICKFVGEDNNFSIRIPILHTSGYFPEFFILKDVCIDKNRDEFSILLTKVYYTTPFHQIYHIPSSLFPSGGSVDGHEYNLSTPLHTPMTLCGGINHETVSMGRLLESLSLGRVKNSLFGSCTTQLSAEAGERDGSLKPIEKNIVKTIESAEYKEMSVLETKRGVSPVCDEY